MNAPSELDGHVERIERDGYTILERVIEPDLLDTIGDIEGAIAAEMPRGSALVCKGSLWRGGGPNTTGARLRKLCGWGLDKKLLGHIDKCSPGYLLEGTPPKKVVGEV